MELQQYWQEFRKQGLGLCAISYDSVAILEDFGGRHDITFPMLSDPQSKIIRDFGILNGDGEGGGRDNWHFGVPHPGTYRVNSDGTVQSKYFLKDFEDRTSMPTILFKEFGSIAGTRETAIHTDLLDLKTYSTMDTVRPDVHITLVADFTLKPNMHVYAPGVEHYIPISFDLDRSPYFKPDPAVYPKSEMVNLPIINETVPVYRGTFHITRDIALGTRDTLATKKELRVKGKLRFQACDDRMCYLPRTVDLEWVLQVQTLDPILERVPEQIQHGVAPQQ